jgi:hypothetical protein
MVASMASRLRRWVHAYRSLIPRPHDVERLEPGGLDPENQIAEPAQFVSSRPELPEMGAAGVPWVPP